MTVLADFEACATLCRKLAEREPENRRLWLAEADRWLQLAGLPATAHMPAWSSAKPFQAGEKPSRQDGG
jgi:hypothetical protein